MSRMNDPLENFIDGLSTMTPMQWVFAVMFSGGCLLGLYLMKDLIVEQLARTF